MINALLKKINIEKIIAVLSLANYAFIIDSIIKNISCIKMNNIYEELRFIAFNLYTDIRMNPFQRKTIVIYVIALYLILIAALFIYHRYQDYKYNIQINPLARLFPYVLMTISMFILIYKKTPIIRHVDIQDIILFLIMLIYIIYLSEKQRYALSLIKFCKYNTINLVVYDKRETISIQNFIQDILKQSIELECNYITLAEIFSQKTISTDLYKYILHQLSTEHKTLLIKTERDSKILSCYIYIQTNEEDNTQAIHIIHNAAGSQNTTDIMLQALQNITIDVDSEIDKLTLEALQKISDGIESTDEDLCTAEDVYNECTAIYNDILSTRIMYESAYILYEDRKQFLDNLNADDTDSY